MPTEQVAPSSRGGGPSAQTPPDPRPHQTADPDLRTQIPNPRLQTPYPKPRHIIYHDALPYHQVCHVRTYVYFWAAFVLCTGRLEIFALSYSALHYGRLDRDLRAELALCNERSNMGMSTVCVCLRDRCHCVGIAIYVLATLYVGAIRCSVGSSLIGCIVRGITAVLTSLLSAANGYA